MLWNSVRSILANFSFDSLRKSNIFDISWFSCSFDILCSWLCLHHKHEVIELSCTQRYKVHNVTIFENFSNNLAHRTSLNCHMTCALCRPSSYQSISFSSHRFTLFSHFLASLSAKLTQNWFDYLFIVRRRSWWNIKYVSSKIHSSVSVSLSTCELTRQLRLNVE